LTDTIKIAVIVSSRVLQLAITGALPADRFEVCVEKADDPKLVDRLRDLSPAITILADLDVCDHIRKEEIKTRILMVSSDPAKKQEAVARRANQFLLVPFSPADLMREIDTIVDIRKTILYVDDSATFHQIVVPALQVEFRILEAYNGLEAVEILARETIDLVVSDIEMPVMNGYELCRSIKSTPSTRNIPVLMLSSLDTEAAVERGFEVGADDYITKPIILAELVTRVARILHRDHLQRPERILVVEDSAVVRSVISQALRSQGFFITEAINGQEGLVQVLSEPYDLVITDYEMAGLDGHQFCLAIRMNRATEHIPIILVSGRASRTDLMKIRSAGIQSFLSKPFQAERLIAETERALAEAKMLKQQRVMQTYLSEGAVSSIARQVVGSDGEHPIMDKFRTILFSDIVGFTAFCESRTPREVVTMLNRYFDEMAGILRGHEGIIDKFIGDAILAVFTDQSAGAIRAIRAGLDMAAAAERLGELSGAPLKIRVGINSGHVIVGDIGSRAHRLDFTVIGDNVNIAQRLEGAAPIGSVLISEATYALVRDLVDVEATEPLRLKGKQVLIPAYRVIAVRD